MSEVEKTITAEEAIKQGYTYYSASFGVPAHYDLLVDFKEEDIKYCEMYLVDKNTVPIAGIDAKTLSKVVIEKIDEIHSEETSNYQEEEIKKAIEWAIDFTEIANRINQALKNVTYHPITDIKLVAMELKKAEVIKNGNLNINTIDTTVPPTSKKSKFRRKPFKEWGAEELDRAADAVQEAMGLTSTEWGIIRYAIRQAVEVNCNI